MRRKGHSLKRHLNRLEHRAPEKEAAQASASLVVDSPSPSASTAVPVTLPSKSVAAVATVLSLIVSVIILGTVICLYRRHKRRTARASPNTMAGKVIIGREYQYPEKQHIDLTDISIYTEKPEKAVLTPRLIDEPVGWVPQIKPYPPVNIPLPEPTASPNSKKSFNPSHSLKKTPDTPLSPPPSYLMAHRASREKQPPRRIPVPPSPVIETTGPPPPTPPANRRTKTSLISLDEQPIQAPSPRSESFSHQDLQPREPTSLDSNEHIQKLPRLMSVITSFTPSLDDELAIKAGDTVRMLDEYRDGWCLVQRVGRIDAPKGAVPRFCLQERRGIVPIMPSHKFSSGSLKSQVSWR